MAKIAIRFTVATGFVVMLLLGVINSVAQDDATVIEYGQTITDEITDETFEITYQFEGKVNDIVIIQMQSDGTDEGLPTPAFRVLSGNRQIVDSNRVFTLALTFTQAVFRLPDDGDYLLVAARRDGQSSSDVGRFTLRLDHAAPLDIGQSVSDIASDDTAKYYVIQPSSPFTLSYTRIDGEFSPSISVSAIQENGGLDQAADMSGRLLDSGTLSITPGSGLFYLIRVGRGFLSNSTGEVEYTLTISAID